MGITTQESLFIYFADEYVGELRKLAAVDNNGRTRSLNNKNSLASRSHQIELRYSDYWQKNGFPISPCLPLSNKFYSEIVERFFQNVLPQAGNDNNLTKLLRLNSPDLFEQLKSIGNDIPSGLCFTQCREPVDNAINMQTISHNGLVQRIAQRNYIKIDIWNNVFRSGIPGDNKKLLLLKDKTGALGMSTKALVSTHILSFSEPDTPNLVLNKFLCSKLANQLGLPMTEMELMRFGKHLCLLSQRVDRKLSADGKRILRMHSNNGGQVLDIPEREKSKENTFSRIFDFCDSCSIPIVAKQQFIDWMLCTLLIHDYNNHINKVGFFSHGGTWGILPGFGLTNHQARVNPVSKLLIPIGGCQHPNNLQLRHLNQLAKQLNIGKKYLPTRLSYLAKSQIALASVDNLLSYLPADVKFTEDEYEFINLLSSNLLKNAYQLEELTQKYH